MFKSIALGYVRHALTAAAGFLLAHGLIDQAGGQILASAGLAIAGLAWSAGQKLLASYELGLAKRTTPSAMVSSSSINS
jgi:hypothetical protein